MEGDVSASGPAAAPGASQRFGPGGRFELRPAEHRLFVDGAPSALGGRALDLLFALAEQPGELHTKAALIQRVWPGLVVEEGNLRVQINGLRRLLGEDSIATVPGRGYRFTAVVHDAAALSSVPAPVVPAAQRLFGRDTDLLRLHEALAAGPGCISLVGTAGVGKSSLARVAAARWAGTSLWVDLAPLSQDAQVADAIARALGGQLGGGDPVEQVLALLPDEPLLLVLDNAEHLVGACARWATALQGRLRLLVTSQLTLGATGERLLRVEPLNTRDGADGPDAGQGALALLIARIAAVDARFEVTAKSLPLLAALCRQLDGLPLALELAAARVPLMGLQAVHDALAERFALLSRGRRDSAARHRNLLDALDWSYGLLEPADQQLFRALGMFTGGFTLELAVTLSGDEHVSRWEVVDGLAALVERSLVTVNGEDPPRYRLLETMRAHALAKLGEVEGASARRRHAAAVLALIAPSDDAQFWLADMENVREAFLWAREHDLGLAAQIGVRASRVMVFTAWRHEVTDWMLSLQSLVEASEARGDQGLAPQLLATWWSTLAYLLGIRQSQAAAPAARKAVALWRPLGNPVELQMAVVNWVRAFKKAAPELDDARVLFLEITEGDDSPTTRLRLNGVLSHIAYLREDHEARMFHTALEQLAARELGRKASVQVAENNICMSLVTLERFDEAARRLQALLQEIDDEGGAQSNGSIPWVLGPLMESLVGLGRLDEAQALVPRTLEAARRFGATVGWLGILLLLAAQQRAEAACRLAGYVRRLWTQGNAALTGDEAAALAGAIMLAQALLGHDLAAALEAEGRGLSSEAAESLALG